MIDKYIIVYIAVPRKKAELFYLKVLYSTYRKLVIQFVTRPDHNTRK